MVAQQWRVNVLIAELLFLELWKVKRWENINSRSKALFIAKIAQDKKAHDIVILDMRKISNITDFFIICSGKSTRQVKAIADYLLQKLKEFGHKVWHIEGYQYAFWVLLDCSDVIVHLFHTSTREFYDLERLWGDAPQISL